MRNKIINGSITIEECDYLEVHKFLILLKQLQINENRYQHIAIEEQKTVVRKAKKQSSSFIFSKHNYSLYKYTINSNLVIALLVKYYNIIIIKEFYPSQQLKILDIILEK